MSVVILPCLTAAHECAGEELGIFRLKDGGCIHQGSS